MCKYVPIIEMLSQSNSENTLMKLPHLHQALKDRKRKDISKKGNSMHVLLA